MTREREEGGRREESRTPGELFIFFDCGDFASFLPLPPFLPSPTDGEAASFFFFIDEEGEGATFLPFFPF